MSSRWAKTLSESILAPLRLFLSDFAAFAGARALLRIGFTQQIRSRITRRLAAAPWEMVSRLRHSRITQLMSADLHQVEGASYILLSDAVAIVMLVTQTVLAFLLAHSKQLKRR